MISETETLLEQIRDLSNLLHNAYGCIAKLELQFGEINRQLKEERELTGALEGICAAYRLGYRTAPAKHMDTITRIKLQRAAIDKASKEKAWT